MPRAEPGRLSRATASKASNESAEEGPCPSRPGLKGSVQYEKESLLCASAAMFFSDGCWEMGLASRPSIDRSSSERLVYCMLQPPCVWEETRSSGRFVWCDWARMCYAKRWDKVGACYDL